MEQRSHIEVRGLTHVYASARQALTALEELDLRVGDGEFVSIIGPSGAGKTTLLKAVGGLLDPTAGAIEVAGMSPREAQRRKAIGFVLQDPSLLPWRTVLQNILLPLQLNVQDGRSSSTGANGLLHSVGLAEFSDYYPHQLSGGMKQRVALARALVMDPAVLLMDEPLGALDEMTRTAMRYELMRVWEDTPKTVLLVTHSIPEAVMMSDRVVVLSPRPGRIVGEVRIELPRPREESLDGSNSFVDYTRQIRETLAMGVSHGRPAFEVPAGF